MRKHSQALQKQHEQNSPLGPTTPTKSAPPADSSK